ncbi:uncharacterized protein LOC130630167 [Hydractinia symbiolongicarpus]|uniref:uncharacterized protein LOC130630167 n=1 Tax=Hydractinia symbiolongicarpus TaxID=13093 RepID=UPI0025512DA3|nr:uncharacterized protein LOC130630167 [Hydractinia symbiolongicarpus]
MTSEKLKKSDYIFNRITEMTYHCHMIDLMRGRSWFKTPEWLQKKHCIINPKNEDEQCFKWAVIAALHFDSIGAHPERISKLKPFVEQYNWSGIEFPTPNTHWKKFERQNPNVALNVYFSEEDFQVRQAYVSKHNTTRKKVADVLIIQEGGKKHYVAIKRYSALMRGLSSRHRGDHYCRNCMHGFRSQETRDNHMKVCMDHDFCEIVMPEEGTVLKHEDGQKLLRMPFVIYADTECILEPVQGCDGDPEKSHTRDVSKHVASGYAFMTKFAHGEVEESSDCYRGKDCMERFCKGLRDQVNRAIRHPQKKIIPLTHEEKEAYKSAKRCFICEGVFKKNNEDITMRKVRDHCHYTGQYRGAAHSSCNLKYRIPNEIPVVMHNRSRYDDHIIIKQLAREFKSHEFKCLGENSEKYISFSIKQSVTFQGKDGEPLKQMKKNKKTNQMKEVEINTTCKIKFINSCRFMQSSLSSLVDNLAGTNSESVSCNDCKSNMELIEIDSEYKAQFKCQTCYCSYKTVELNERSMKKKFSNTLKHAKGNDEHFKLLLRKGVYPYEYMDAWERFEETALPPKAQFYSSLNLKNITENDYKHAQKVWKAFNIKNLGEYHDLYVMSDTLLLADVFENFRDTCQNIYELDPAYFYTAPGLAWQAALKVTGQVLELLSDIDMLLMVEKGLRGGICQAIKRHAKANNPYMGELFDVNLLISYLLYIDANKLYGGAMSQKLPTHGFKWREDLENFTQAFIENYKNGDDGYFLEVDVHYPKKLHKLHNDLPFLPEKMRLNNDCEKLTCNVFDKEKYVLHIRKLQQALQHGLVLTKVHRVIEFKQSAWLKPYIDLNTKLRKDAKNDFEKDFFKLMNNSVFGKTMENVRKHGDIKLVTTEWRRKKLASVPNYHSTSRFDKKFVAMEMNKVKVVMNKPVYLGLSILDFSKLTMYKFHYDYIKPKFGAGAELCYMDTDSFVYHIKTDDVYKDIAGDVESRFDTSNYSPEDKLSLPIGKNKKKLCLMKDELGGKIMIEFVALRSKMYAYKTLEGYVQKKAKGTKKCVVKKQITFADYLNSLQTYQNLYRTQLRFTSRKHEIFTEKLNKIALSVDDDKRLQAQGGFTFAHGSSPGLVCKQELLTRVWHPDHVKLF